MMSGERPKVMRWGFSLLSSDFQGVIWWNMFSRLFNDDRDGLLRLFHSRM